MTMLLAAACSPVVQPGDLLRLKLDKKVKVKHGHQVALRMQAPQFIFSAAVQDASGNVKTLTRVILVEDFAGAELDRDEVVPGTENQRGMPLDADALEEFQEHVGDLLEDGFVNPSGLPSAIITG